MGWKGYITGSTPRFGGVPGKSSLFCFLIKSFHYTSEFYKFFGFQKYFQSNNLMRKLVFAFPPCLTELEIFFAKSLFVVTLCFYSHCWHRIFFLKRMSLISTSVFWYFIQTPIILSLEYVDFIYLSALFVHLFIYLFTDIVSISHLVESFFP